MKNEKYIKGMISTVIVAYNRGHLIKRSIASLLNQTYKNREIIVVDNGSTDDTTEVLEMYKKPEYQDIVRIFRLEQNRKFAGGANYGLKQIRGEWFTILDDDDTAYPEAFEKMMDIPLKLDPKVTAVTCNCVESGNGKLGGTGPTSDQYLSFEDTVNLCQGEFWGITKTELIENAQFNEDLLGYEDTFWFKLNSRANRYYIHEPLRVQDTTHGVTISQFVVKKNRHLKARTYRILVQESFYLDSIAQFQPNKFRSKCIKGLLYLYMDNDVEGASIYAKKLVEQSQWTKVITETIMLIPQSIFRGLFRLIPL